MPVHAYCDGMSPQGPDRVPVADSKKSPGHMSRHRRERDNAERGLVNRWRRPKKKICTRLCCDHTYITVGVASLFGIANEVDNLKEFSIYTIGYSWSKEMEDVDFSTVSTNVIFL